MDMGAIGWVMIAYSSNCFISQEWLASTAGGDSIINATLLYLLTLKVLVTTIDVQWEGMGDVGSARYEPALLPPCPTIRVLSYSN